MHEKKVKTPLCKIGKLVIAYNVTSNNMIAHSRVFFALYTRLNDSGTGHTVLKLSSKQLVTTPKCKPKPMAEDIISLVNDIGNMEGMPDELQFHNIHHKLTLSNLYANEVGHNDDSYASDNNWNNKEMPEQDVRLMMVRLSSLFGGLAMID